MIDGVVCGVGNISGQAFHQQAEVIIVCQRAILLNLFCIQIVLCIADRKLQSIQHSQRSRVGKHYINIVLYAKQGEIVLRLCERGDRRGVMVRARDQGPGIPDIRRALQGGFSTSRSLGLGLPGVRRLMDEFEIESRVGYGTTVTARKWRR